MSELDKEYQLIFQDHQTLRQYELLAGAATDGHWVTDRAGHIVSASDKICRMYGYERDEILGRSLRDFDAVENEATMQAHMQRIIEEGQDRFETRHRCKDGRLIDVEVSTAYLQQTGNFIAYVRDVTEKKQIEAELLEVQELFTLFMKYSPIYTFIKRIEGNQSRVITLSENFVDMVGRPAHELLGRTMEEIFPAEFARKITEDDIAVVRQGRIVHLEEELNGLQYITIKFPILREGRDSLLAGFTIDVTEQKRSEEAIRQQAQLLDIAHDSIVVRDMEDRILYWNQGAATQYGISREEALGQISHDLLQVRFPQSLKEIMDKLQRDDLWEGELQHVTRKGSLITVSSRWVLQRAADGSPVGIMEINNDITKIKEAERERDNMQLQMFHAQKLESLGLLAGGIAHDFNNLLTSIMGNTELALMQLEPESRAVENLRRVEKASRRAADLVKQMLAYSGKGKFTTELIDLNRLVEEMVRMLETSISKKASLRLNFTRPLRHILADATQMRQVVMNLVINASEALGGDSGEIAVTTAQRKLDAGSLQHFWCNEQLPAGWYVSLIVSDTGCGIDKETQSKIFDPFFSTKFTGRGLGMAAVLGIIRGHKGAIKLESEVGRGTTFTVLLPAREEIAAALEPAETPLELLGQGVVLLVDDEEEVCELVGQMLTMLGYEVVTARDGQEAPEINQMRDDFVFVVLDLTMPVMDGEQAFVELRRINPDARIIISSGYSEQEVAQRFAGKGVTAVLQKPFDLAALRHAIPGAAT